MRPPSSSSSHYHIVELFPFPEKRHTLPVQGLCFSCWYMPFSGPNRLPAQPQVVSRGVIKAPPLELNIRGRRIEEGLEELERRLDSAYLAGMPFVRVIHGKGTGRLREAIRQALKDNPYVSSFEPGKAGEGGDGVTVVRLAIS